MRCGGMAVLTGAANFEPGDIGAVLLPAVKSDRPPPENPAAYRVLGPNALAAF